MDTTTILWRATGAGALAWFGQGSWWSPFEDVAREYMQNPGFGGPCLYRARLGTSCVLNLIDDSDHQAIERLATELEEIVDGFDPERFVARMVGNYAHSVIDDGLRKEWRSALLRRYDWISIMDSFPEDAVSMCRLSKLSAEERAGVELVEMFEE